MKIHYKGKYDLDPDSLPRGEHRPGAVAFREAKDSREMGIIGNVGSILVFVVLIIPAIFRCRESFEFFRDMPWIFFGCCASMLAMFPHELLHALCFKEDAYIYTNFKQGMLFVVGPETMSKGRFVFMSLLPNLVFGAIPYVLGMIFPELIFFTSLGILCLGMGFGDYYNVFNALTQMPRGARTYLHGFHSYWYMP